MHKSSSTNIKKMPKDYRKIVERHGFKVIGFTGSCHYALQHVDGHRTTAPASPGGGGRSMRNFESHLKKVARGYYVKARA